MIMARMICLDIIFVLTCPATHPLSGSEILPSDGDNFWPGKVCLPHTSFMLPQGNFPTNHAFFKIQSTIFTTQVLKIVFWINE